MKRPHCLLCDDRFNTLPDGMTYRDFGYIHGFADGVRAAGTGVGPKLCARHKGFVEQALAARGIAFKIREPN